MIDRLSQQHWITLRLSRIGRHACLLAAILVFGWTSPSFGVDREDFYFATLDNTYTGMHVTESRMALLSIMKKIFGHKYPQIRLHLDFLVKDSGLVEALTSNRYDIIATTGLDYLSLRERIHLRPLAILSKTDEPTDTFMLITRKNKTLRTLAGFPNRTLIIEAGGGGGEIAKLWLDTVLKARGLPP